MFFFKLPPPLQPLFYLITFHNFVKKNKQSNSILANIIFVLDNKTKIYNYFTKKKLFCLLRAKANDLN